MKHLTGLLREIAKRRKLHTQRFEAADFAAMQQKDCDVKPLWNVYHRTAEAFLKADRCFNCRKAPAPVHLLVPVGKDNDTEQFCSEDCRAQFGILKGTT